MIKNGAFAPIGEKDCCRLPQGWQDQIVSKFERLEVSPFPERGPYDKDPSVWKERCLPKYSALLGVLEVADVHPSTSARISELLLRKLKLSLRPLTSLASDEVHFIINQGFHAYLRMSAAAGTTNITLSLLLRAAIPRFSRSVGFLEAYLAYEEIVAHNDTGDKHDGFSSDESSQEDDCLTKSLIENLSSPSHELRLISLKHLERINQTAPQSGHIISTMLEIEDTTLDLNHVRLIAMLLRKLSRDYVLLEQETWLQQAVPNFLFGMLTVKLSPIWDEAVQCFKEIVQTKTGEDAVCSVVFKWLNVPSARWTPSSEEKSSRSYFLSDFECTSVRRLEQSMVQVLRLINNSDELMRQKFEERQQAADLVPGNARARGLKVFDAIASCAEKRSRQLVPHFLAWADEEDDKGVSDAEADETRPQAATWSLTDRKALLGVFSQFMNPRVLYQHEHVYDALLNLMGNGDADIQKMALRAILAWKQEGVRPYQENLEYLLDDARFKNEITVLLQGDNVIKPNHRPELMPVLLRLLYGRAISKKGAASGRHGLYATRLAILRNLSIEDMGSFLEISTGKLRDIRIIEAVHDPTLQFDNPVVPARKQMGLLNMLSSLISELGTNVGPYMDILVNVVLYCLVYASRELRKDVADNSQEDELASNSSILRSVRSTGLKCLDLLFQNAQHFLWTPYQDVIVKEIVAPRLQNMPSETTQGVSGLLRLLSTWSILPRSALCLAPYEDVLPSGALPQIVGCISLNKTKDEVKIFALGIIRNLIRLATLPSNESEFNEIIKEELIDLNAGATLAAIQAVLDSPAYGNDLLETCIETVVSISPLLKVEEHINAAIRMSAYLLKQPPRRVSPKLKGRILLVLENFVSLKTTSNNSLLLDDVFGTLSSLFSYFKDRENRQTLSRTLAAVVKDDQDFEETIQLCMSLNSYKTGRIDEPDYDQRLTAFSAISKKRNSPLSPKQWLPVLHNLVYLVQSDEEFGILSSNSADGMRRFIQDCSECDSEASKKVLESHLENIILPSMYAGAREASETVRREILRVFGFLITTLPRWDRVADLNGLLSDRDGESVEPAFFFNLLSPATAKQIEALRILESANDTQQMGSQNISQFFIPLLEHFIFGRVDGSDDHGLGAQATNTIGSLALSLQWKIYRTILRRYISYIASKPELQKQTIRLLGRLVDSLALGRHQEINSQMVVDGNDVTSLSTKTLWKTYPSETQLYADVMNDFIPPLVKHLHEKDESEVSYRVPVGVIIVKLLKLLPADHMNQKLAGVLTDICHILRSKSWESREMARDTLVKIAAVLGPSYIGFILKELRGALTKGYQLHVLSYTVHSILVTVVPNFSPGDLDYCVPMIVTIVMDDIFGTIGQEKDAEGYVTQMKEVKSSKSQDSMELVARNASITQLINLIRPLQSLLLQKIDLKMVRKIDSLMTRITAGLLQNTGAESRDTLVFCYEVIQEVHNSRKPEEEQKVDPKVRKYLVQRGANKSGQRGRTTKHTYKLARFAFDLLRSMFKKHDNLRTASNIAGFLPILGDAIIDGEDEVKISAFRLLAVIVKVPFPNEDGANIYKVAVKEATKSIAMSSATTTDLSQAALKMLAVVLRDRKDIRVTESAVDMLLGKLKDDLTEPLYRHVTFNFLRSVLDRQIETAAVYDTMDYVGTVMITNDDQNTRELARGAFFQFIREYPQTKARWGKQLDFIVANLQYSREGGRLSVTEVVHLLLMKSSGDFVQQIAATCFLPLFLVIANDDSERCRLAACELIKMIFQKADKERTQTFLSLLRSWLEKEENAAIRRLALLVFGYYFEARDDATKNKKDFKLVVENIAGILRLDSAEGVDEELFDTALGVVRVLTATFPEQMLSPDKRGLWDDIMRCIDDPEPTVNLSAVRLISIYLAHFAKEGAGKSRNEIIEGSYGLQLEEAQIQELVRRTLRALGKGGMQESLATESGQVLIFLWPYLQVETESIDKPDTGHVSESEDERVALEGKPKGLHFLLWRLSHILRKEIRPTGMAIVPKTTAMEVLETICRRCPKDDLRSSLKTMLMPLHHLTDPTIPVPHSTDDVFKTKHEALKTRAQILMDALQKKYGTMEYSQTLLAIREEVKARRQERSSKRKIDAIAQPEKYGRDKRKKFERNKERRKTKSKEHRMMRQAYKGW